MDWFGDLPTALQASALAAWARGPAYAGLNVLHLLGLVLVVGGIGVLDLRLCGLGRAIPVAALARLVTPPAVAGLCIAALTGFCMFAADAVSLADSTTFRWKLALVALGLMNALVFRRLWQARLAEWDGRRTVLGTVLAAGSLAIWLAVGALGRLIAYT